jgi:hypothetical protein
MTSAIKSARTRTPHAGKTNRPEFAESSIVKGQVTKTAGSWALSQTMSGRPQIESHNPARDKRLETVGLLRLKVPEPKEWISEQHENLRLGSFTFADTMIDLAEEKKTEIIHAIERHNAARARRKLQRLVNQKFAGSVDVLFENADVDGDGDTSSLPCANKRV